MRTLILAMYVICGSCASGAVAAASNTQPSRDSNSSTEVQRWLETVGVPYATKYIVRFFTEEEKRVWENTEVAVADESAEFCQDPLTPASSSYDTSHARRLITICARSFRWLDDLAEFQAINSFVTDQPASFARTLNTLDYMSKQVAKDYGRMIVGLKPQLTCIPSFLIFNQMRGAGLTCDVETSLAGTPDSIAYTKWLTEGSFMSQSMRSAMTNLFEDELKHSDWRMLFNRFYINIRASMLTGLILHEFAHHLHGDPEHPEFNLDSRKKREIDADLYAFSFIQRVPEAADLWADFVRFNFALAYCQAHSLYTSPTIT